MVIYITANSTYEKTKGAHDIIKYKKRDKNGEYELARWEYVSLKAARDLMREIGEKGMKTIDAVFDKAKKFAQDGGVKGGKLIYLIQGGKDVWDITDSGVVLNILGAREEQ